MLVSAFFTFGVIADNHLTPILTRISTKLSLSQALSGVTILAFANGAGDVISSYTAGGSADEGIFISLGGIIGAGIFDCTLVLANCIFKAKGNIKVD